MSRQPKQKQFLFIGFVITFFLHGTFIRGAYAQAQTRLPAKDNPPTFDFAKERAADLAFSAGREAEGLKSAPDKVSLQLEAARVLAEARPRQALLLIDSAWDALTKLFGSKETTATERYFALRLRIDLLAFCTKLDPERARKMAESLPGPSDADKETDLPKNGPTVSPERQRADYLAQAGLEKLRDDPAGGADMAVSSLSTGKVSMYLSRLPRAIFNRAGREAASDFEKRVADRLSNSSSFDRDDHTAVADLLACDPHMPLPARRGLLRFLSSSLQSLAQRIKGGADGPSEAEMGTLKSAYSTFTRRVRPYIVTDWPENLELFDAHLSRVTAAVPQSWLDFNYDLWTKDPAADQLSRALKTPDRSLRDTRLMSLAVRALNGKVPGPEEDSLALAAKAVAGISSEETRAILSDYLRMAEVMKLAREKAWAAAADKALTVVNSEWRAWVLLGLADVQPTESPNGALALHEEARRALEKSPSSPRAAELMFLLARFVSRYDPPRAVGIIAAAVKCANRASAASVKPTAEPSLLQTFYVHLGSQHFAPGQELSGVEEIELGEEIGRSTLYDWAGVESISKEIEDARLRIRYQLAMSRGVLTGAKGR